ncbi:hypothetical protein ACU686_03795 [Yinghuangia aomiensis]
MAVATTSQYLVNCQKVMGVRLRLAMPSTTTLADAPSGEEVGRRGDHAAVGSDVDPAEESVGHDSDGDEEQQVCGQCGPGGETRDQHHEQKCDTEDSNWNQDVCAPIRESE